MLVTGQNMADNTTTVKELRLGQFFTKKEIPNPTEYQVWVWGTYLGNGKYSCTRFSDINDECKMGKDKQVFINFTF